MKILDQALEAVRTFRSLNQRELKRLLAKTAPLASTGRFELFKTTSIFDRTASTPEWLGEEPKRVRKLMPQ